MYRGPAHGGRSKASASTLCQKCLKRGHYSYECTVSAQERPYKSRPSRTQQLLNPSLKPKLTTEVPTELLRKKGVADEILAKKEEERGRKPDRNGDNGSRKHSRSVSAYSSDSVSTISTNRSVSRSRSPKYSDRNGKHPMRGKDTLGKRGRRSLSTDSNASVESHDRKRSVDRNTRRRLSSFSPPQRGRRRGRSRSSRMDISHDHGSRERNGRRHLSQNRSHSRTRGRYASRSRDRRPANEAPRRRYASRSRTRSSGRMDTSDERHPARNDLGPANVSPIRENGRSSRKASPRSRSRSRSVQGKRRALSRSFSPDREPRSQHSRRVPVQPPASNRFDDHGRDQGADGGRGRWVANGSGSSGRPMAAGHPPPQRERSLSPYSKRVALTRAMQTR